MKIPPQKTKQMLYLKINHILKEILMNGVESFKNVKKNISEIKEHDRIENDPLLKLSTKLHEIDKGISI
jgi:hypothetical protein